MFTGVAPTTMPSGGRRGHARKGHLGDEIELGKWGRGSGAHGEGAVGVVWDEGGPEMANSGR